MNRNTIIVILVGINLFLLAGILLAISSPPVAMAQRVGGAGNYLVVTGQVQDGYDALYLIDLSQRRLHAATVNRNNKRIEFQDMRDLSLDFRAR